MGRMGRQAGKATPPTSPVTNKLSIDTPGYTLIELLVVLFVLLLMTTAIVPRVIAIQKSRRLKDMEARVIRLPTEARNEAVRTGKPIRLRVDGAALVMEQAPLNGTSEEVKRVALGAGLQVDTVEQDNRPANVGSWQWVIYPDGTAEAGGIQFTEGAARKSLSLFSDGGSLWVQGDLPDGTPERWPAGRLQQRTSGG